MKKNFLAVAAVMVSSIFVATTIAQAADVTFSGSMKTRMEVNEQSDFLDSTEADEFIQSRVRLNATANINDSTSAFIQMQSVRTWGNGTPANTSTFPTPSGSGNSSLSPNDADTSVGIHQAYFTLKNFATLPVDLKLGRQEVVLDGHRLFGNTLWTIGAQTHDAVRLTHTHNNMTLTYAYIRGQEENRTADPSDLSDVDVQLAYLNYQGILGGTFSATYAYMNDGCGPASAAGVCSNFSNDIHNIGFRQAGQLYGIDYRGEFNYQFGDARGTATTINANKAGTFTAGNDIDREAYMFGVRIGKSFENVMLKPKLTLWYDYLSGTSEEDARNNEVGSFNTLFDTGHKFYGLMDNYLGIGAGGNSGTDGLGLQDVAIKTQISPMPGWTLEANYHFFYTAEGYAATANGIGDNDNDLGTELDVTLVNKYNANTKIVVGYSNYSTSTTFRQIKNTGGDSADWAYLMFDVNF